MATCHPDLAMAAKGLCATCYGRAHQRAQAGISDTKTCPHCGEQFLFYRRQMYCSKACSWEGEKAKDRVKAALRRPARAEHLREYQRQRNYGLAPGQYAVMLAKQYGKCAICGQAESRIRNGKTIRLSVDHSHLTGIARSLLCSACNQGIGHFRDEPKLLRAAADYLDAA